MTENNVQITIRWDFKVGDELPYALAVEALEKEEAFSTNCLEFFNTANLGAKVVRKDGKIITVKDLLNNIGNHTKKRIRKEHNLHKLLVSGGFDYEEVQS